VTRSESDAPRKPARADLGPLLVVAGKVLLFALLLALVLGVVGVVLISRPHHRERKPQTACANHLRQLGGIYASEPMELGQPVTGGVHLLIEWFQKGLVPAEYVEVFRCPDDPSLVQPDVYEPLEDDYEEAGAMAPQMLGHLFSYAVRDFERFPLDPDSSKAQWIMCDRQGADGRTPHHQGGLNVLFDDGAVQFKDRAALGLGPDDPIVVGPESTHPELKKMIFLHPD
jgi:hypothetical protein